MIILKKQKLKVYNFLFNEGVIVVKVDYLRDTHDQLSGISNLEVMCIIKTLHTKEVVKRVFNWGYFYYFLTEKGVTYLREFLALPEDLLPSTHKQPVTSATARLALEAAEEEGKKSKFIPSSFKPEFAGESSGRRDDGYRRGDSDRPWRGRGRGRGAGGFGSSAGAAGASTTSGGAAGGL